MKYFLIILSVMCFVNKINCQASLTGIIDGFNNDAIFIEVNALDINNVYTDTIKATNGKFRYTKNITEPTMLMIQSANAFELNSFTGNNYLPHSKRIFVLLTPNDSIDINGKLDKNSIKYTIKSLQQLNSTIWEQHHAGLKYNVERLEFERKMNPKMIDKTLTQEYLNFREQRRNDKLNYIHKNPNEDFSAFLLIGSTKPNELIEMYGNLSDGVKNGIMKKMLDSRLLLAKQKLGIIETDKLSINTPAPDFTFESLNQKVVSRNDLKGKYIMLDFWGSWCAPCIKGFPKMKEYYNKYSSKVEFIGVACNDNKDKVLKLVKEHNLNWLQSLDSPINNMVKKFKITNYPTKVLIDNKGRVVGVFEGESEGFYNKMDIIFN